MNALLWSNSSDVNLDWGIIAKIVKIVDTIFLSSKNAIVEIDRVFATM